MDSETPDFTNRQIPNEHLIEVCKYRQGSNCCRYIFYPRDKRDFYCIKGISEMQEKIDQEASSMTAKGDNCPGILHEES